MPSQVSYDSKGVFHVISVDGVEQFKRTEDVLEQGVPDVAGWETSYLITAKLSPAGQGTPTGAPGVWGPATINGATGELSHS